MSWGLNFISSKYIYVIYRAGGPYGKKLCPRSWVRPEAEGRGPCSRPRAQFFSHTDRPRPVNNLFIFFYLFAFFANSADKNPDRSVSQKAGPVTSARLANQIRGFGIPARWDAFGKNKFVYLRICFYSLHNYFYYYSINFRHFQVRTCVCAYR